MLQFQQEFLKIQTLLSVNAAITGWNFTTTDTRVDLISLSEDGTSTPTAIDAKLELGFSEKVVKGIGYIDIKKSTTDALVERIDIVSSKGCFK